MKKSSTGPAERCANVRIKKLPNGRILVERSRKKPVVEPEWRERLLEIIDERGSTNAVDLARYTGEDYKLIQSRLGTLRREGRLPTFP